MLKCEIREGAHLDRRCGTCPTGQALSISRRWLLPWWLPTIRLMRVGIPELKIAILEATLASGVEATEGPIQYSRVMARIGNNFLEEKYV